MRKLSSDERKAQDQIRAFASSRKMEHLFDNSILWVASISVVAPSARDHERVARLIVGSIEAAGASTAPLAEPQEGSSARPAKRSRQDLALEEAAAVRSQAATVATTLAGSVLSAALAERRKKTKNVGSQGPTRATEAAGTDIIQLDERSSGQEERIALPSTVAKTRVPMGGDIPVEISALARGERVSDSPIGPTHRRGKEPIEGEVAPSEGLEYPYPHLADEIEPRTWERLRTLLIGSFGIGPPYNQEPDPEHRHKPAHHFDVRGSVLESRIAQSRAVEQFWLPRDEELLGEVPNVGLHQCLPSYRVRGALVEQEIFGRMEQTRTSYLKLLGELEARRADTRPELENVLKELSAKEDELADWRREMVVKEMMIEGLRALVT